MVSQSIVVFYEYRLKVLSGNRPRMRIAHCASIFSLSGCLVYVDVPNCTLPILFFDLFECDAATFRVETYALNLSRPSFMPCL